MFLLQSDYWEVKESEKKGRGVFAKENIAAGTIIGDYLGKILPDDAEEKENDGFYEMYYTDDTSVWPDPKSEGIHLINHSCEPNCFMYTYQGHTLYFATRKIFTGEEITVSYCLPPIDEDCAPCEDICHCGSEICTGTMHLNDERYERWRNFDDAMAENFTIPPFKNGDQLPKLSSYPENIEDNDIYPLFGAHNQPPLILQDDQLPSKKDLRKMIRESGQQLHFQNLNVIVWGITDNYFFAKTP
jgi:uncharacterized protein